MILEISTEKIGDKNVDVKNEKYSVLNMRNYAINSKYKD